MEPESVAEPVNQAADGKLWLHALASNAPHVLTSFLRRELVH